MPRILRIEYPGALYHVINRGNYQRDLFESVGAAKAFLAILGETAKRYGWGIHAYVLMSNHFHLAVETPEPTLVEGMHWLQCTMANRFNRFRGERGHLFQGRYKSLVIEDMASLSRVVDYIHLNPVRAWLVTADQVGCYRWSSLAAFTKGGRLPGMRAQDWLQACGGWRDDAEGWRAYEGRLVEIGRDEARWEELGLTGLSKGWAIGTSAWRRTLAEEHGRLALSPGLPKEEALELRRHACSRCLRDRLAELGRTHDELAAKPRNQPWKLELARRIRSEVGAPVSWLAEAMAYGKPSSLRSYLSRLDAKNQQTSP